MNHDEHYRKIEAQGVEPIKVMESQLVRGIPEELHATVKRNFNVAMATKYLLRLGEKDAGGIEIAKAQNYLHRAMTGEWRPVAKSWEERFANGPAIRDCGNCASYRDKGAVVRCGDCDADVQQNWTPCARVLGGEIKQGINIVGEPPAEEAMLEAIGTIPPKFKLGDKVKFAAITWFANINRSCMGIIEKAYKPKGYEKYGWLYWVKPTDGSAVQIDVREDMLEFVGEK